MSMLHRDGVGLFYEEAGDGDPPILLVHGIACDHTYLAPQFEYFGRRHRVVAVDLRGHGRSEAPQQEYTIEGFADDLAWMCGALGLEKPVAVGHSLGGEICLALAVRFSGVPSAVVAMDSTLVPPEERIALMRSFLESLKTTAYREELRRYFSTRLFLPTDDQERKERILEKIIQTPQHVVASAWANGFFNYDTATAVASCEVPLLYIDAGTPNTDLLRLARLCSHLVTGKTVGSGHFHQLEVPDQVNAMIGRFIAVALQTRDAGATRAV